MSVTGLWFMATVPDERVREWRKRFADELAAADAAREEGFAWRATVAGEPFVELRRDRWSLTDVGLQFSEMQYGETGDELADELMSAAEEAGESGRYVASVRKGSAAAALNCALGYPDAEGLPGNFGEFVLTADAVARAVPDVERILGVTGARRDALIEQIGRWLEAAADEPGYPAAELLDGPLRLFREAAAEHLGLLAATLWF